MTSFLTAALYKFVELQDFAALQDPIYTYCEENNIKGTILLAAEGINGTIAGSVEQVHKVLAFLRQDPRLADLVHKESYADKPPFYRLKVRLKQEIVKMGVPGINPTEMAGQYVKPEDWNAIISDPSVVVIDVRNDYEVGVGTFKGAINPQTKIFSELPDWVKQEPALQDKPKVAMFCTGGIRCEKSTAFLRSQGFEEVYHLEGGILKYLETVPEVESLWEGECFVFDERVTVRHGLELGHYELCRACRNPIGETDKASAFFMLGVSCPHCYDRKTEAQKQAFAERQKQIELAQARQQRHMGAVYNRKQPPQPQNDRPILYSFRRCPFAMRSRLAIAASGQVCELREVVLRDKPQALLDASPKGTVPVLIERDGQVIDQSLDIMLWALQRNDPEGWLTLSQGTVDLMLALIAECDGEFKQHLDRYKYPERYPKVDAQFHRTECSRYLERLNAQLSDMPYLFGQHAVLADMAIVPFVRQFAITDLDWFNAQPWPDLQTWLATWMNSALYTRIMQKYPQWRSGDAGTMFPEPL
jgi:UPF0176 protein